MSDQEEEPALTWAKSSLSVQFHHFRRAGRLHIAACGLACYRIHGQHADVAGDDALHAALGR